MRTTIEELDQMRTAHVEELGRFDRGRFSLQRRDRHTMPGLEVLNDCLQVADELYRHVNDVALVATGGR